MKILKHILIFVIVATSMAVYAQTTLNYSRPGPMMHIPTSSLYNESYLLRIGVAGQSTRGAFESAGTKAPFWKRTLHVISDWVFLQFNLDPLQMKMILPYIFKIDC